MTTKPKFTIKKKPSFTIGEKKPVCTFGERRPVCTFGEKKPPFTIKSPKKVKDVPAFHQGTSMPIKTKEDLKEIVEEPCLKACQELFEKHIETMDSGCNGENCPDCAYIIINYDTLDDKNQQIADNMVANGSAKFFPKSDICVRNYFNQIFIKVPTSPEELVSKVEARLCNAIRGFVPQRRIVKKMDPQQIIAMHMRAQNMK